MYRYIIAYQVKGELSDIHTRLVDDISIQFGLRKINSPSHVTLKDSIYIEDVTPVEKLLESLVANISYPKASIRFQGIGDFRNEVFFIKAELNEDAQILYKSLYQKLQTIEWLQWDQFDTINRNFHLTITTKSNQTNADSIRNYLQEFQSIDYTLALDNIIILKKIDAEKKWIVYKEYKLSTNI